MLYWKHLLTNNFSSVYVLIQTDVTFASSRTPWKYRLHSLEPISFCFTYWYHIHFITITCWTFLTRIVIAQQIQAHQRQELQIQNLYSYVSFYYLISYSVKPLSFKPSSSQLYFTLNNRFLMSLMIFIWMPLILITTRIKILSDLKD